MTRGKFKKLAVFASFYLVLSLGLIYLSPYLQPSPPIFGFEAPYDDQPLPHELQYRQSLNNCGSYAVTAALNSLYLSTRKKDKLLHPENVVSQMTWRWPGRFTLPQGLEKTVKDQGVGYETPSLYHFSDEQRLIYLRSQLANDKRIVLLVDETGYQHYITVLGYGEDGSFSIYDPINYRDPNNPQLTRDDNGAHAGNRDLSDKELIKIWSRGGIAGVYRWYALIVYDPNLRVLDVMSNGVKVQRERPK